MLTVAAGATFAVDFGSAPSTGYVWQVASLPEGVQLLGSDYSQPPGTAIGGGGTQVFRLKTTHAGNFLVRFELKRRWEPAPIQTREIEVAAR
jgi:predicted secreted protein